MTFISKETTTETQTMMRKVVGINGWHIFSKLRHKSCANESMCHITNGIVIEWQTIVASVREPIEHRYFDKLRLG